MSRYPAILNLGFRLFFFTASVFAVLTMLAWLLAYQFGYYGMMGEFVPAWWHGHEMLYGYAAAVVTGFLFTAVQNWTGVPMPRGWQLFLYWLPWFVARLCFALLPLLHAAIAQSIAEATGTACKTDCGFWFGLTKHGLLIAACFDLIFALGGLYGVAKPVFAVKQWRQMGLVSKMALLAIGQVLFILGLTQTLASGILWSLYLGIFIVIAIVLTIGRRVMPFFTEKGVGYPFTPKNSALLDRACLLTFTAFFLLKVFTPWHGAASVFAFATAVCNAWRLAGWYTYGIWRRPLLWSMYLSFAGMIFGFFLFASQLFWTKVSDSLAVHALTFSGIGLLTLSMMARVSLGHSGRSIHEPPRVAVVALYLLCVGFVFRVILPLLAFSQFQLWIAMAQVLWIFAFCLLLHGYTLIWFRPRVDGKPG